MNYRDATPSYEDRRRALLNLIEGVRYRRYIDDGWVTIGVGFNLGQPENAENRRLFLHEYLGLAENSTAFQVLDIWLTQNWTSIRDADNDGDAQGAALETPLNNILMITLTGIWDAFELQPTGRRISFETQAGANDVLLSPGMAVTAEVTTGTRRLIEYVLSPVMEHVKESRRER